jgi:ABC-2 type transport system ATP-binding protein
MELKQQGTTIVLTTQYLEEADQLCDTISVIDVGQIIAEGTADELKKMVGGDVLALTVSDRAFVDKAITTLAQTFGVPESDVAVDREFGNVSVPVTTGADALVPAVRALDAQAVPIADMGLRRPSLDDVFLSLTGHLAEEERTERAEPGARRRRVRMG